MAVAQPPPPPPADDGAPTPPRLPATAASFRRRSKFGSFTAGDGVVRTQPLPAVPGDGDRDPEDFPNELGAHFRKLVLAMVDGVVAAVGNCDDRATKRVELD